MWSPPSEPNDYCSYNHCYADTPFGRYQIEWKGWKSYPSYGLTFNDRYIYCPDDLSGCQKAAQVDYETKILGALE